MHMQDMLNVKYRFAFYKSNVEMLSQIDTEKNMKTKECIHANMMRFKAEPTHPANGSSMCTSVWLLASWDRNAMNLCEIIETRPNVHTLFY
ncbi:hypothetical protein SLA2020_290650 [Shorea laevis]